MKKRTAFIGAILSLIPLGQPLIIKTGVVLSTTSLMLSVSEKLYAGDYSYYFNSAYEKGNNGNHYGAISDFTKAIEINPSEGAYYNRGNRRMNLKDYYGAISDYIKAIELDPTFIKAYINRSIAKEKIGDINGACFDAKKAISLGDNNFTNKNWIKDNC